MSHGKHYQYYMNLSTMHIEHERCPSYNFYHSINLTSHSILLDEMIPRSINRWQSKIN